MTDRPNILWICTDSQRFDTLGCYGNPHVHTPNIDRLAEQGLLFEHCYAQNPLCSPSRATFLTGRYPVTHRLRQNGQNIPEDEVLVTKILSENEYVCGLSGKLHLGACNRRYTLGDEWWKLGTEEQLVQGHEKRIDDGYTEFYWDHAPNPNFRSSAYNRWLLEKGLTFETHERDDSAFVANGMPSEHHQVTFCVEKAIGFMQAYQGYEHHWCFSVNPFDPHFNFDPPEDYLEPYLERLDEVPLPNYVEGELEGKPPYQKERHEGTTWGGYDQSDAGDPHEHRMLRAAYWAMCDHIDKQIGRLLDALDETGQRENTLVIFTSDHGELLGDHGLYKKGPYLYDPAVRVPLIISWPDVIEPGRTDALVELGDLAPTVLEACGLERHPGMQARSLWPMLTGEEPRESFRDDIYCEYYNANPDSPPRWLTMVRTHEHKIIVRHGADLGELYDMQKDPGENRNLWDDADYAEVKMAMLKRAADRMAWTADPLPRRIGIY
jgi:arylsulfatase A-like enzyme